MRDRKGRRHGRHRTRVAPRTAEQYFARATRFQDNWNRVTHVIAKMRAERISLRRAAREVGISPSTVLRWGKSALRKNRSGRFEAKRTDRLLRVLVIPTRDGPGEVAARNSRQATQISEYSAAVHRFLETGDMAALRKFEGKSILDASGRRITFLTDPNELTRLGSAGVLSFESLYARVS